MISISVETDISAALKMLRDLEADVPRAAAIAINRTAASVATEASRVIAAETGLGVREVRQRFRLRLAEKYRLLASVTALPYSPNVKRFAARPGKVGASAAPWRRRRTMRRTFLMPSGNVVVRKGKERFPVKSIRGPSVRLEFMKGYALDAMRRKVAERFPVEFERALRRVRRS